MIFCSCFCIYPSFKQFGSFFKEKISFKGKRKTTLAKPLKEKTMPPSRIKIFLGCKKGDMLLVSLATCTLVRRRILAPKGWSRQKAGSGSRFSYAFSPRWRGVSVWRVLWAQGWRCRGCAASQCCRKEQELSQCQLGRLSCTFWGGKNEESVK